jgi:hypothetical protein
VQLAWRQPVAFDHGLHAPLPLQVPSFEQSPAPGLLARHRCLGSDWPSWTGEQVPSFPATLQLMQSPPGLASLQAVLQQTPSVQLPLLHCAPRVQTAPFGLRPQEPFTQVLGGTQSLSRLQLERHAVLLHAKVPQDTSVGVAQLPRPSQAEAGVCAEAVAQVADLQASPLAKNAQAPARQAPVVPHVDCAVARHTSCGSGAPSGTAVQSPSVAARLQALQASVQAALQQTPWAQKPDSHSPAALHSAPVGFFPHEPATQKFPGTQSASLVQLRKQLVPLHTNGLQVCEGGATHCPARLHVGAAVKAPWSQVAGPHSVPSG